MTRKRRHYYGPNTRKYSHRGRKYTLIWYRDKGVCKICKKRVTYDLGTIDHIRPYSHMGSSSPDNLQLACSRCNTLKGNTWECDCGLPPNGPGCRGGIERGWKIYADKLEMDAWYRDYQNGVGPKIRENWRRRGKRKPG